jgi:Tfp pilus assembly PilM family ATPase
VDIGRRHIKLAQVRHGRLLAWACINRSGVEETLDVAEVRRVAEAIRCGSFRGRSVVLTVPPTKLLTGILELPPRSSGAPVEQLAKSELARRHEVDAQTIETSCWDLPSPARAANRTYMMAVACAHGDANSLVDAFEAAGLNVQSVETHSTAVARSCGWLLDDLSGTGAILDVGWASSQLMMMYQGIVVYHRNLAKCGLESLSRTLAKQPQVPATVVEQWCGEGVLASPDQVARANASGNGEDADKMSATHAGETPVPRADGKAELHPAVAACLETVAAELRIPLSYLANQYPDAHVKRLLLIGGGARVAGLADFLNRSLNMDVRVVKASDLCQCDAQAECGGGGGPSLAVAIGLAQYTGEVKS